MMGGELQEKGKLGTNTKKSQPRVCNPRKQLGLSP